jgi:hypothetical protein
VTGALDTGAFTRRGPESKQVFRSLQSRSCMRSSLAALRFMSGNRF